MSARARAGAWLVAAYVAVAVATTAWAPGAMRPLFDGFGSHPGEYLWVNPPKKYAEGNRPPERASTTVRLAADGSAPGSASPPDGQVLAQLSPLSIAAHQPDESARVDVEPVDAGTLAPLPAGLRAGGNAYRITFTYLPSGTAVDGLAVPGRVGLTAAEPTSALLFSADGSAWERRDAAVLPQGNGLTGELKGPGFYLAAAEGSADDDSGGGVPLVVYVLGAAVALGLGALALARRNRTTAAAARSGRPTSGRPGGTKPKGKSSQKRKRPKRPPPKRR